MESSLNGPTFRPASSLPRPPFALPATGDRGRATRVGKSPSRPSAAGVACLVLVRGGPRRGIIAGRHAARQARRVVGPRRRHFAGEVDRDHPSRVWTRMVGGSRLTGGPTTDRAPEVKERRARLGAREEFDLKGLANE